MEESRDGGRRGRAGPSLQHESTCGGARGHHHATPGCRVAVLGGSEVLGCDGVQSQGAGDRGRPGSNAVALDRKSTRLNSSHLGISYAVFCLKKKKKKK